MGGAKLAWALLLVAAPASAQNFGGDNTPAPTGADWGNYSTSYAEPGPHSLDPFLETAVPYKGYYFTAIDHSPRVPLEPEPSRGTFRELNAYDSADVYIYAPRLNPDNAGRFEYRVLLDSGRVVIPWSPINRFTDVFAPNGEGKPCGLLGGYHTTWGHYIEAELREKKTGRFISTTVIYWQEVKPALFNIYMPDELGAFLEMNEFLQHLTNNYYLRPTAEDTLKWLRRYARNQLDTATGIPYFLRLRHEENNLVFYLNAHIIERQALEYQLVRNGSPVIPWRSNEFDLPLIWLRGLQTGKYTLSMRFRSQRHNVTGYSFSVEPAWTETVWFKVAVMAGVVLLGVLCWVLIRLRTRVVQERRKRERLNLELKSIRSQLNPHFVFNALASIQGLVNNQQIEPANRYLSEFGRLMRETLSGARKDFVPLATEIATLDTYLKLEQLRFPFVYHIQTAADLPVRDIEVPSLLLQPLVENAVKHGVSAMLPGGIIEIGFTRENANFTCTIRDNGQGFDTGAPAGGYGLSLTRDRIRLLNEALDGRTIDWRIESSPGWGTRIILIFQQWIN